MRIVAWNLDHRCGHKKIHAALASAVAGLAPHLLLLTEYVQDPGFCRVEGDRGREKLRKDLAAQGLRYFAMSVPVVREHVPRLSFENQVAVFSREPFRLGGVALRACPHPEDSQERGYLSNLLHVTLPELHVIGLRVPDFPRRDFQQPAAARRRYWEHLLQVLRAVSGERVVVAGDLNLDPHGVRSGEGRLVRALRTFMAGQTPEWTCPQPVGRSSYCGCRPSCIDHALLGGGVRLLRGEYVQTLDGQRLGGPRQPEAISDHAPLLLEVV